jgi:hypothetical protein
MCNVWVCTVFAKEINLMEANADISNLKHSKEKETML